MDKKNTDRKYKDYRIDDNVDRVSRLPEPYILAVEEIVDCLDDDWKNRIVYGKYISYLCDEFEEALRTGKTVEDVIGPNAKEYADRIQAELQFSDTTPTNQGKITNFLLIINFLIYLGVSILNTGLSSGKVGLESTDYIFIGIGLVILLGSFIAKYIKMKAVMLPTWIVFIQLLLLPIILFGFGFTATSAAIIIVLNIVGDFVISSRQVK